MVSQVVRTAARRLALAGLLLAAGGLSPVRAAEPLWVEGALMPAEVFVQGQAVYSLRLWQDVAIDDVQWTPPRIRLGDVHALGGPERREAVRQGRRYRVVEQRWAIVPFASGAQDIEPAIARGRLVTRGRSFSLQAEPATLTVLPQPADWSGPWLPAAELRLEARDVLPAEVKAEQVFRRAFRVTARGVLPAQLPAPVMQSADFAIHPLPPQLSLQVDRGGLLATREQVFELVARRTGTLVVPAVRLDWWQTGAVPGARRAELPAATLMVLPADHAATTRPAGADAAAARPASVDASLPATASGAATRLHWGLVALPALALALLALGLHWRRRAAWRALARACRQHDPQAAGQALLRWAAGDSPQATLARLAERYPAGPARAAIEALDRRLYGPSGQLGQTATGQRWHGASLLAAMRASGPPPQCTARPATATVPLPPLYPS